MGYTLEQLQKMGATPVAPTTAPAPTGEKKGLTFEELQKMGAKQVEAKEPSKSVVPEEDGIVKGIVKAVTRLPARAATNLIVMEEAARGILGSDSAAERAKRIEKEGVDAPFWGNIRPIGNTGKGFAKDLEDVAGAGVEAASYAVPVSKAVPIAKGAFGGAVRESMKAGAKAGAASGALSMAGTEMQNGGGVLDVAKSATKGAVFGGATGAVLPLIPAAFGGVKNKLAQRAQNQVDELRLLKGEPPVTAAPIAKELPDAVGFQTTKAPAAFGRAGASAELKTQPKASMGFNTGGKKGPIPDARIAAKKLSEEGKVITDPIGKEAVRQGIPAARVALIKSGTKTDKTKMAKMLAIRESQLTNERVTDRATDVVGDTFVEKIAKPIAEKNRQARQHLNIVAKGLSGKKVDPSSAIEGLAADLSDAGVKFNKKTGALEFKDSIFEGLKAPQKTIQEVWNRAARSAKSKDALKLHHTKSFIDEHVHYGKEVGGLSGKAQGILKRFRHNIDAALDTKFKDYNEVNTVVAETIGELEKIAKVMGRDFKAGDNFADAHAGTVMRGLFSNSKMRTNLMQLLESSQGLLKKHGIELDEDLITQSKFADTLEEILGSEAPTSFMGQIERGTGHAADALQTGSEVVRGNVFGAAVKGAKLLVDITRNVNKDQKLKALRALLEMATEKPGAFSRKFK